MVEFDVSYDRSDETDGIIIAIDHCQPEKERTKQTAELPLGLSETKRESEGRQSCNHSSIRTPTERTRQTVDLQLCVNETIESRAGAQ